MWSYMGPGMGLFMALFWAIVAVGLVALVWALLRTSGAAGDGQAAGDRALHILEERYARGEIGREEFQQKRHDIGH